MSKKKEKKAKKAAKTGSRSYRIVYAIFARLVGWILRIHVVGKENEPTEGGFIVCGNHTSATDAIVMCYAFRKHQVRFMAKKELFKVPVLAPLIRFLGAFPIDRGGNDVGAIRAAVSMVKEGSCMGMFPQGHRYPGVDPRTTPTKNGAALICTRAEADVMPVYILRKKHAFQLFRKTYVVIGEKIPYESFGYDPEANGEYLRITGIIFDRICSVGEAFIAERAAKKKRKKKA